MRRTPSRLALRLTLASLPFALAPLSAHAWYIHAELMPWIIADVEKEASRAGREEPPELEGERNRQKNPAADLMVALKTLEPKTGSLAARGRFSDLGQRLLLNSAAPLPSLEATTGEEILRLAVDDPDAGMDQNLPDSADPRDDRRFMGGTEGPTSQGFRHMWFHGWDAKKALATFQVPAREIGQAPERFELLAGEAREYVRRRDFYWAIRLVGWSMHYIQDLTQPFHTNQVPSPRMVPWGAALRWPPAAGFDNLVRETTRTIGNYHWAYEGYVEAELRKGRASVFNGCLSEPAAPLAGTQPSAVAREVDEASIDRSPKLAAALMDYFGTELKDPEWDLAHEKGKIDYAKLAADPAKRDARARLNALTCESLRLAKSASVWLVRWAFYP